jgi:DNA-binding GntR family transcriptional regulator
MTDLPPDLNPARGSQLRDIAYDHVKELIVSNRLPPGTLLTIDDLVRRLAVSRTPVREALLRLQSEHLVEILPQRAVRVTEIRPDDVRELFAMRELLECAAVEHASQTIPAHLLDALDAEIVAAEAEVQAGQYELYVRVDLELHSLIRQHSGNGLLSELLALIHDRARRVRIFSGVYHEDDYVRVVTAEHRALVDAFRRGDGAAVRRLLSDHLRRAAERILTQIEAQRASAGPPATGAGHTLSAQRRRGVQDAT